MNTNDITIDIHTKMCGNGKKTSSPSITREEYKVIKSVLNRIGVTDLHNDNGVFFDVVFSSYGKYFINQPKAVMVLAEVAKDKSEQSTQLNAFIDSLTEVNAAIQGMLEERDIFQQANILCEELQEAEQAYA